MRNKISIKEGEIQRILGLHKKAILEETKITPISKNLLMEKSYAITLKKRDGVNSGGLKPKDVITKVKVKNYNSDLVELDVTFESGGSIDVSFNCATPDVMVINGDGQMRGSEYRVDKKFKNLIKWYCAGKPKKDKGNEGSSDLVGGGSEYKQKKDQMLNPLPGGKVIQAFTIFKENIWKQTDKGAITKRKFNSGTFNVGFLCNGYKDYNFIYGKKWFKNKELGTVLKKRFCNSKKQEIETEKCKIRKPKGGSVKTQDVSYYYNGVSKCEYGQGSKGFKSEKECNKTCVKQIDNEDGDEGSSELTKVRGNRYTFDFDTIMKAINDTGKCGGFSGSSDGLSGTSGTQGTAGTSGDGGIQNPLPITNRLSKDLYFKMISD